MPVWTMATCYCGASLALGGPLFLRLQPCHLLGYQSTLRNQDKMIRPHKTTAALREEGLRQIFLNVLITHVSAGVLLFLEIQMK